MPADRYVVRTVHVAADEVASVNDALQIILRLPYLDACDLASVIGGDVDKMVQGAEDRLIGPAKALEPDHG